MKLQYLGDSKDSFKWDYHDYLMSELNYPLLNIVLMMTPNDKSNDGKTEPEEFPARKSVLRFCRDLKSSPDIERLKDLPKSTGASYQVMLHKNSFHFTNSNRTDYFSGFNSGYPQIVFLDPDNGFEPEKSCKDKHISYTDVSNILAQLTNNSIVTVFQHFRRVPFQEDFARIRKRLKTGYSTAIHWNSLMFIIISTSKLSIKRVIAANQKYKEGRPVKIITGEFGIR